MPNDPERFFFCEHVSGSPLVGEHHLFSEIVTDEYEFRGRLLFPLDWLESSDGESVPVVAIAVHDHEIDVDRQRLVAHKMTETELHEPRLEYVRHRQSGVVVIGSDETPTS